MECFRKWPCCLLISVIFVFPPIWTFHGKNICAQERLCKCHRNSAMVDIICTNIKSLYPVQSLLWNQFSKTLVNKLILSPNCELTSLSGGDFNTSIRMIYAKCPFSNIAADAFRYAKSLININLDATTFSNIPEGLSNLKNLNTLKINHGKFVSLGREPWNLSSLLFLHLPNGQLKELHKDSLKMSAEIMVLDLPFNEIRTIHPDTFDSLKSLYSVNLRCNHIVTIDGLFKKLNYDLKKLDLYDNELTSLDNAFHDGTWKVQSLNIGNPWQCDCRLIWLIEWLNKTNSSALMDQPICNSPQRIRGKPLNKLTLEDMTYSPEDCPEFCRCTCVNQMSKVYIDVDCSNSNLTHMPIIFPSPVKFLDLSNNALEDVSSLDSFQRENLINLNLEQNKISVLGYEFPKNLEVLKLSGNQMKRFPWSSFSNNSLREVTLSDNPWICDCKTVDFRIWLLSEGEKVTDINDTKCGQFVSLNHLRGKVITSLTENDICPSKLGLYLGICTGSLGLLFLTAMAWFGYRRYRLHVIVWLYSHGYTSFKDDNLEEEKMFDGYLVYCSTDAEFALTEILPGLEEGEPAFNICVSARDVILGQPEVQAALNPVGDSKRIILILSRYFTNDELCISIFRAAFAQFLEDKVHRLIMIKKDDLPLTENVDSELKIAMTWSNCLTWGDNLFWEKLRYAMPKKVINSPVGNVCEVSQPEMYLEMQLEHN